jgi:hypothetical protein
MLDALGPPCLTANVGENMRMPENDVKGSVNENVMFITALAIRFVQRRRRPTGYLKT